jgi:hypothetical protein
VKTSTLCTLVIMMKKMAPYTLTPVWDILLALADTHSGTRTLGFTSHSKDEAIEVKLLAQGHKRGGP